MTINALEEATSRAFQVNTVRDRRGEDSNTGKSLERKNIFNVEIRADMINIIVMVKKVIIKIFSQRNSLKKSGNSSW
jgi:hypothetical protein